MDDSTGSIDLMSHCKELSEDAQNALSVRIEDEPRGANPSADVIRPTIAKCPRSKHILEQCALPFGFLVEPFRDNANAVSRPLASCYNCDAFINPFTKFINEDEWTCNLCDAWNSLRVQNKNGPLCQPVPNSVEFCRVSSEHLTFIDADTMINKASLTETYLYAFDTSKVAVQSGYLSMVADIILSELDAMAQTPSARIGFITYNKEIHLYRLSLPESNRLEKFVLTDLDEMRKIRQIMIPRCAQFLLNARKHRNLIADFLRHLAAEYSGASESYSAVAPALYAVYEIMRANGGRVTVFQKGRPSIGKDIDSDESYREIAKQCRYQAIALDLFLLGGRDMELPTLSLLCRETGGSMFRFGDFNRGDQLQCKRLERSLRHYLTRFIGFSSVIKVYLSPGLSLVRSFSGCCQSDDGELEMNIVHPDVVFGFDVTIDHQLLDYEKDVYFQVAVSYTSKEGELLTRVHTLSLPVSCNVQEVIRSADAECIVGLWTKYVAVWMTDLASVNKTRQLLSDSCIKFLKAYNEGQLAPKEALQVPSHLKLLPYHVFNILSTAVFRPVDTRYDVDSRAYLLHQFASLPLRQLMDSISPALYVISPEVRRRSHLCLSELDTKGGYLLNTADVLYLIVGDSVSMGSDSSLCLKICESSEELPECDQLFGEELRKLVDTLLRQKGDLPSIIQVLRDDSLECLQYTSSRTLKVYQEFLVSIKTRVFPKPIWTRLLQMRIGK